MTGAIVAAGVLAAASVFGLVRRRRDGVLRGVGEEPMEPHVDVTALGGVPGERATLVQFSSAFCAPCRATRRVLDEVVQMVDGVTHLEVDAEQNLELVRRLDILRTPTVLVLDGSGRVVRRAVGQPRKADVIAALGEVIL